MSYIYLDIETIPTQSEAVRDEIAATIAPPASMKKAETIEKWEAEKKPDAVKEAVAKTSFDGGRGHVCTIAWAVDGDDIQSVHVDNIKDERGAIEYFFNAIDDPHSYDIVGHYVGGFDIRFLTQRAIVLGARLPRPTVWPRNPKPWDKKVFDTMTAWAGDRNTISMDNLCSILGIDGKADFDGSMVADAWAAGEHEKIRAYCEDDVRRTRRIHSKFLAVGF